MEGATKQSSQLEEEAPYDVPLEMRMPEAIVSVRREMHILLAAETQRSLARFASFRTTSLSSARPVSPTARRPTTYRTAAPPRLVETLMEMKARQSAELSSRFLTKIPAGVRLLVVDSRVTSEGSERVNVAHVESAEPIGWVTARRKRLSEPILRELKMTRSSRSSEANSLAHEGSEAKAAAAAWPLGLAQLTQRARLLERTREAMDARLLAIGEQAHAVSLAMMDESTRASGGAGGACGRQRRTVSQAERPRKPRAAWASPATATPARAERKQAAGAAQHRALPSAGSCGRAPGRDAVNSCATTLQRQELDVVCAASAAGAASGAASAVTASAVREKEVVLGSIVKPLTLMTAADMVATTAAIQRQAESYSAQLHAARPMDLRVGAALRARMAQARGERSKFFADLFLEWDPNRDGGISKMELRVGVRKLLDSVTVGMGPNEVPPWVKGAVDVKEVDALFESLDADKSGELSSSEVKRLLPKLEEASAAAVESCAQTHARIEELRQWAADAQAVADVTQASESAALELSEMKAAAHSASLGSIFKKKGHNAVLQLIDKSWPSGGIAPDAFAKHVGQQGLGLRISRPQMDALFHSLDAHGSGVIEVADMKAMVQPLIDSADQQMARVRQLSLRSAELTKVTRLEQERWRTQQRRIDELLFDLGDGDASLGEVTPVDEPTATITGTASEAASSSQPASSRQRDPRSPLQLQAGQRTQRDRMPSPPTPQARNKDRSRVGCVT